VQSIETGMALLKALATLSLDRPPPMLKTIAAGAGLAPAKAHRYLVSFLRSGLVERDSGTGRYRLGPLAQHLGIAAIRGMDVIRTANTFLPDILEDVRHSLALAVWGSRGATVVWVEEWSRPVTISTRVGEILPLLTSATGRVFGAWLPRSQTELIIDQELRFTRESRRPSTVRSREEVLRLFERIRTAGIGWTLGEVNPGINALSVPIFDYRGGIVAALSSLGPPDLFDASPDGELATRLRAAAARISTALGYRIENERTS
jgi:DNA-binding IclR family transcriptional regulator